MTEKRNDNYHIGELNRIYKFLPDSELSKEIIEFLQLNVQTETINPPGNETKLANIIMDKFENENSPLITTEIIEVTPNRGNLIVTIKGKDSEHNPTWGLSSHLDVVAPDPIDDWKYPPFSGKLVEDKHDSFIWGRGAMDMKYVGVAISMAMIQLIREGFQPKGDIKLIFEADEEISGFEGMKPLVDDYWDKLKIDHYITEGGGYQMPTKKDFAISRGEKGKLILKIRAKGVSGHGSTPGDYKKFALYKLNKAIKKIMNHKPKLFISDEYKQMIDAFTMPNVIKPVLKNKYLLKPLLNLADGVLKLNIKKVLLGMISITISPTIIDYGKKENVISPKADLTLDIRMPPGCDREYTVNYVKKILGKKLSKEIEFIVGDYVGPTLSPINTISYELILKVLNEMRPESELLPIILTAGTDSRHTRRRNVPSYGFCLTIKDEDISYDELMKLPHSPNERISVRNVLLSTEFFYRLIQKI